MMAMAASPTPKAHNHPPYKQMIVNAIHALKDRKGSSRRAIAKHIEANYKELPPAHDALLSHHLGRLKRKGVLLMIKHSYKLNPEGGGAAMLQKLHADVPKKRGRPPKNSTSGTGIVQGIEKKKPGRPKKILTQEGTGLLTEKKKLGRPHKKKALSVEELILPKSMKSMLMVVKTKRGRPRKGSSPSIALGEKRKPGRPKKGSLPVKPKLESAVSSGEKRKRGRPRKGSLPIKPKLNSILSAGQRRKPGRPKKVSSTEKPKLGSALSPHEKKKSGRPRKGSLTMKAKLDSALTRGEKRKPGRPKKGSLPVKLNPASITGGRRKPGRPKKGSDESMQPKLAAGITSGEKRKRGRPKKSSTAMENEGGKAPLIPKVERTEKALTVIFAPTIVDGVLASAEDENNGGPSISLPEKPVEGSPLAGAPQGVAVSGEKRKRGRPKMKRDDEIPHSSIPKRCGRPPKTGNAVALEETDTEKRSVGQLEEIVKE